METINCIFCGIDSSRTVIEENGYLGRKCLRCGLLYISPRPTLNEIFNLYGHDAAHVSASAHIAAAYPSKLISRHHLKLIAAIANGGSLLEIGAGAGYFLDQARTFGFAPHGLEFNPIQASFIRDKLKIPCTETPLDRLVHEGMQFDIVYHCDVVSHFFDPIAEFRNIHAVLKEGGILAFETGNLGELADHHLRRIPRFQYPDHLFFFNTGNLQQLLTSTGFQLVKLFRYSIEPEMQLMKLVSWLRNQNRDPDNRPLGASTGNLEEIQAEVSEATSSKLKSRTKKVLKNLLHYTKYFFRYKIGYLTAWPGRPQTMLLIAQKVSK